MIDSMDKTGIRPRVIEEIRELARKYDVQKVILFGSRARGDYRRTSDIDLAVEGGDFDRFALDMDEETYTLLKYDIVDLSRDIQPGLRCSIEEEGVVLYEKV
jgi:predicted nucleotidyltransferase